MWYLLTMEYYSAMKKNEILPFAATWMELEYIMLSEISKSRERQIPYDFIHMWNLGNKTDEHTGREKKQKRKQTIRETLREQS